MLSTARAASSLFTCPKHVREVACDESTSGPAPRRSTFLCIGKRLDPHSHSQTSSHSWTGIRFADGWPTVLQYYQPGRKPDFQSLPPFYAHRETTGHCSLSQRSERVLRLGPRSRTEVLWLSDIYHTRSEAEISSQPPCNFGTALRYRCDSVLRDYTADSRSLSSGQQSTSSKVLYSSPGGE